MEQFGVDRARTAGPRTSGLRTSGPHPPEKTASNGAEYRAGVCVFAALCTGETVASGDANDDANDEEGWDTGTTVKERPAEPKLARPPMFKVIMLNDDYTPMEFVVDVLMMFFHMDQEKAWQVMYAVHTTGSAVAGIFPRDIAETKSEQVNAYAQENEFPLRSTVEMTD